ncbi:MAG: hypothetical protein D0528_12100 [Methylococcales bacterium]|nr:MAG: hypothetical protein D0528_12100 [Methylococcales bacterium]
MYDIIKLLFEICLFKKGPQDIPYSVWLLRLLMVIYASVTALMLSLHFDSLSVLMQLITDMVLVVGFVGLLLSVSRKLGRFNQTLSAVLGTDAMISFMALPGMATLELKQGGLTVLLIIVVLMTWHWAVLGHIISKALDKALSFGFGLAFLYLFGSYQLMGFFIS